MITTKPPTFDATNARITAAALELHRVLRDALERVIPSMDGARACGRALGLRRHLGWQVYAIARTSDHATVMRAMPKDRGWKLVLQALEGGGCQTKQLNALRFGGYEPGAVRAPRRTRRELQRLFLTHPGAIHSIPDVEPPAHPRINPDRGHAGRGRSARPDAVAGRLART